MSKCSVQNVRSNFLLKVKCVTKQHYTHSLWSRLTSLLQTTNQLMSHHQDFNSENEN